MAQMQKKTGPSTPKVVRTAASHYLPRVDLPDRLTSDLVTIAEMANAFGVTHRTLHFYEEKNLIVAQRSGIMRVYDQVQVQRMAIINLCREIGMPIAIVQDLMEQIAKAQSQEAVDRLFRRALLVRKRELLAAESTIRRQMQQISGLLGPDADTQDANMDAPPQLSQLEREFIGYMSEGCTATRLARVMNMDYDTVLATEKAILAKFEANNRFQAVAKAIILGIVES
jgi:DNA-binding transcriptional MerR regulator